MYNTFSKILEIDATILANQTIDGLKSVPILKHLYSEKLYQSESIKLIFAILGFIFRTLKKIGYNYAISFGFLIAPLLVILLQNSTFISINQIYICVLFTIPLTLMVTSESFKATESKYVNVILLKLDAKDYFYIEIFKNTLFNMVIMLLPLLTILLIANNIRENLLLLLGYCFLSSFFVNLLFLYFYDKKEKIISENKKSFVISIVIGLIIPCILLLCGLSITLEMFLFFILLMLIVIVYILIIESKSQAIYRLYKRNFSNFNNVVDQDAILINKFEQSSKIELTEVELSKKESGYKLFNDLFFSRHKELIHDSIKNNIIIIFIIFVMAIIFTYKVDVVRPYVSEFIEYRYLELTLFILFANRGIEITKAMFFHCDRFMLNYNFYRKKETINNLYNLRLISMLKYNIIPAIVLILGINILNVVSGNTSIISIICITISTLALSFFFSVFYLSMYYIIQPFKTNMKNQNLLYTLIIISMIYVFMLLAEYVILKLELLTILIVFTVITLSLILIILSRGLAPKNFKIK